MTNYKQRKIHFANAQGLHLCQAKRSFIEPLLISQEMAQVTCLRCLQGKRSKAWREYLGVDRVTFNCSYCGQAKTISAEQFRDRMKAAQTKKLYCERKCQAKKTPKKTTVIKFQ